MYQQFLYYLIYFLLYLLVLTVSLVNLWWIISLILRHLCKEGSYRKPIITIVATNIRLFITIFKNYTFQIHDLLLVFLNLVFGMIVTRAPSRIQCSQSHMLSQVQNLQHKFKVIPALMGCLWVDYPLAVFGIKPKIFY